MMRLCFLWTLFIRLNQQSLAMVGSVRVRISLLKRQVVVLDGALALKDISATITDTYDTIDSESIVCFFLEAQERTSPTRADGSYRS